MDENKEAGNSPQVKSAAQAGKGVVGFTQNLHMVDSHTLVLTSDMASAGDVGIEMRCLGNGDECESGLSCDDSSLMKAVCGGRLKSEND